jgi:hypothetical protein
MIDVPKTAFVQGRLDLDEPGPRVGQALAAPTYADLTALTADIPARLVPARPPQAARKSVSKKAVVTMTCATAALAGLWPVMMLRPPWPHYVLPAAMIWFALAVAVPAGWVALLRDWLDKSGVLGRRLHPACSLGAPHAR